MKPLVPLALLLALASAAQTPPADGLVSPEVHPDRTVTFRVRAPKASEVTLYGDWMPIGKPDPMTKAADGIWSITTQPLEATGHLYWFNLDGIAIADPINPVIKLRQRTSASLVEVPAATPGRLGNSRRSSRHGRKRMAEIHRPEPNRENLDLPPAGLREVNRALPDPLPRSRQRRHTRFVGQCRPREPHPR